MINNEQDINIIRRMLTTSDTLHPKIFNANNQLYPYIYKQLTIATDFVLEMITSIFPNIKIRDIVLSGSMLSYTYTKNSDLDIFIIADPLCPDTQDCAVSNVILERIAVCMANRADKINIFGHPIDFGFTTVEKYMRFYKDKSAPSEIYSYGTYSLLNNEWVSKSIKQQHLFTAEQYYEEYLKFKSKLDNTISLLPKINGEILNKEGVARLNKILFGLKKMAFIEKEHNPLHEYSKNYNLYRIAKRLKLFAKYYNLLQVSKNYHK